MGEEPSHTDVETYAELEAEVGQQFEGDWREFLSAVENPAEILHFVFKLQFAKDRDKFADWAAGKELPADWVPRFYTLLDSEGELLRAAPT